MTLECKAKQLIKQGYGRRKLAQALNISERQATKLIKGTNPNKKDKKLFKSTKEKQHLEIFQLIENAAEDLGVLPSQVEWKDFKESFGIESPPCTYLEFNKVKKSYFAILPDEDSVYERRRSKQASVNKSLGNVYADQQFIVESIEEFTDRVYSGRVQVSNKPKKQKDVDRVISLILSDLHISSDLDPEEVGHSFGKLEESRRLAYIAQQIANYKTEHRKQTRLNVYLLGDIIQNSLHHPRDGAQLSEQACRALHLLLQMIAYLAEFFDSVNVYCATGNHGRFKSVHPQRAIHQKWDSLETFIYYALKKSLRTAEHVEFHIPKTPFVVSQVFGHKVFSTHGDTVLNVGNPSEGVPMGSIEKQVNKINASLPDTEKYAVFQVGHVHKLVNTTVSNSELFINGALVPPDPFAVSLGNLDCVCGQWMYESTPDHAVGDMRKIILSKEVDHDTSLDSIIEPWESFSK